MVQGKEAAMLHFPLRQRPEVVPAGGVKRKHNEVMEVDAFEEFEIKKKDETFPFSFELETLKDDNQYIEGTLDFTEKRKREIAAFNKRVAPNWRATGGWPNSFNVSRILHIMDESSSSCGCTDSKQGPLCVNSFNNFDRSFRTNVIMSLDQEHKTAKAHSPLNDMVQKYIHTLNDDWHDSPLRSKWTTRSIVPTGVKWERKFPGLVAEMSTEIHKKIQTLHKQGRLIVRVIGATNQNWEEEWKYKFPQKRPVPPHTNTDLENGGDACRTCKKKEDEECTCNSCLSVDQWNRASTTLLKKSNKPYGIRLFGSGSTGIGIMIDIINEEGTGFKDEVNAALFHGIWRSNAWTVASLKSSPSRYAGEEVHDTWDLSTFRRLVEKSNQLNEIVVLNGLRHHVVGLFFEPDATEDSLRWVQAQAESMQLPLMLYDSWSNALHPAARVPIHSTDMELDDTESASGSDDSDYDEDEQ